VALRRRRLYGRSDLGGGRSDLGGGRSDLGVGSARCHVRARGGEIGEIGEIGIWAAAGGEIETRCGEGGGGVRDGEGRRRGGGARGMDRHVGRVVGG